MEFAIDLIQKIPAGWPRWAMLAAIIAAYFFFPDIVKKLGRGEKEKETIARLMQFLKLKRLLVELEVFQKEKNLPGFEFPAEARLLAELKESATAVEKSKEKIPYLSRLAYSLMGGFCFFLLAALLFVIDHHQEATVLATARFLVRDLVFSAGCGLLGSLSLWGAIVPASSMACTWPLTVPCDIC